MNCLILAVVQLAASLITMALLFYVMIQLDKLRRWIDWVRGWIGRANERLKELEDWTEK